MGRRVAVGDVLERLHRRHQVGRLRQLVRQPVQVAVVRHRKCNLRGGGANSLHIWVDAARFALFGRDKVGQALGRHDEQNVRHAPSFGHLSPRDRIVMVNISINIITILLFLSL
jgi:hypothetical protein